jgi:hypothetical protein
MRDINLPRHVMDRFERRWAARFAYTGTRGPAGDDPFRSPQIRRLLEGALRPPTEVRVVPDDIGLFAARASTNDRAAGGFDDGSRRAEP